MASGLWNDFIYVCRTLRARPGFAAAAVLLLAIGIGGTSVIFSVVDAVMLRRLAVPRAGELARLVSMIPSRPPVSAYGLPEYEEWRARTRGFSSTFAESDLDLSLSDASSSGGSATLPVRAGIVTGSYFPVLGVPPELGRLLTREDEWATEGELPMVLSYEFWRSRFHGDPRVLGHAVHLNGQPFVVVGVLPKKFNGISVETGPQIRVPLIAARFVTAEHDPKVCCVWEIAGRLRPELTPGQAEAETVNAMRAALLAVMAQKGPVTEEDRRGVAQEDIRLEPVEHGVSLLRRRFGDGLLALLGGALLLLVLACANIAGLLLARAAAREQETAVRAALGATHAQLARLWMVETALLAAAGGVGGLVLACTALPFIAGSLPPLRDLGTDLLPVALNVELDWRLFGFVCLLCTAAAVLAGLSPAWHASRTSLTESLKSTMADPRRARLRTVMAATQVAICTIVLANSGLLVETFRQLETAPTGFDSDHVVTFTVDPKLAGYGPEQANAAVLRLEREVRSLPGVAAVSLAARGLMRGSGVKTSIGLPGTRNTERLNVSINTVAPEYFDTMGMKIVAGRGLQESDGAAQKPAKVVVNQAFVRRFFPKENPVGRHYGTGFNSVIQPDFEIVGVVSDARYRSVREDFQPTTFECLRGDQTGMKAFFYLGHLEVRTYGPPEGVIVGVEGLMRRIDPNLPFREVRTLKQEVRDSMWAERTLAGIGSIFSLVAAAVACIGLYGLLSFTLAQRRREIGIRMALGAGPGEIARVTLVRALALVAAGAAAGILASLATARLLTSLLYGVTPTAPSASLAAVAIILLTGALAAALPAWRASRVDPADTLRM
ncbi:MAG TPA: ADOP family duplicated permease [Candidatus Acidoferrales bacterium]|nr:ADOP family duplicated permease [Candidatus Acidoferrales bacterium]